MATKRIINEDKDAGRKTYWVEDVNGLSIETHQDVTPIIEANKRATNDFRPGSLIGDTQAHQRKIADIPVSVYNDALARLGPPHQNPKAWLKWLADPDNRFFRTTTGNL